MSDTWLGRKVLGRYVIRKKLGEGGMSVAYSADGGGRDVVVKLPNVSVSGSNPIDTCIDKLKIEGEILERIWRQYGGHPNIVRFIDRGDEGMYPVVVEEYVPGQTLAKYAASKGGLDPHEAFEIGEKLADVLNFLHSHGIVHRDFAADNVMMGGTDPVLIDFGTAKEGYAQMKPGTRIGKPCVTPPEQAMKGYAYFSSDVYMWASMLMGAMRQRGHGFDDAIQNFCRYITPQGALTNEPCNFVECDKYASLFNKVFKEALNVDTNKRIKDGAELYKKLTGKPAPTPTGAYLLINGKRVPLDKSKTYILGKEGSGADIEVPDPELRRSGRSYISRRHARIWYDKSGGWLIQDLGSVNGTMIIRGGQEILVFFGCRGQCPDQPQPSQHELKPGDQIVLAFSMSTSTPYVVVGFYE